MNTKTKSSSSAGQPTVKPTKNKAPVDSKRLPIETCVGKFVMPGHEFLLNTTSPELQQSQICLLGPGLKVKSDSNREDDTKKIVAVCKPGILTKKKPNTFYVDVLMKNYTPAAKEDVIGIITKKAGDQYLEDIGTRDRLSLSKFSFEGATKKNRPDLKIGDIVYGRILDLPPDYPFEITCVVAATGRSHGLGPLENGFVFRVPVYMIQRLHQKVVDEDGESFDLLSALGKVKNVPFEVAIGANGFIWVKSKSMVINILLAQVIQSAVDLPFSEYKNLAKKYQESTEILRESA